MIQKESPVLIILLADLIMLIMLAIGIHLSIFIILIAISLTIYAFIETISN